MTARRHWEPNVGEWVAYRDEPARRFNPETKQYEDAPGTRRIYLYDDRTGTGSTTARDCTRFDTKAEAQAAARDRWPQRVKGCRIGAERITTTKEN